MRRNREGLRNGEHEYGGGKLILYSIAFFLLLELIYDGHGTWMSANPSVYHPFAKN